MNADIGHSNRASNLTHIAATAHHYLTIPPVRTSTSSIQTDAISLEPTLTSTHGKLLLTSRVERKIIILRQSYKDKKDVVPIMLQPPHAFINSKIALHIPLECPALSELIIPNPEKNNAVHQAVFFHPELSVIVASSPVCLCLASIARSKKAFAHIFASQKTARHSQCSGFMIATTALRDCAAAELLGGQRLTAICAGTVRGFHTSPQHTT